MIKIQAQSLITFQNRISHGFFGRQGGHSTGVYDSLNCALHSQDDVTAVQQNRAVICAQLSVNKGNLCTLSQVHGANCAVVTQVPAPDAPRVEADAIVTDTPDLAIGVLTADCGPVLYYGQKPNGAPVIGAAHAGWGGALKGVLEATIDKMIAQGATPESLRAAVGPCIGPRSYEVSEGFEKPFLAYEAADEHFFRPARKAGHFMFDLPGYIASRLARAGVSHVEITGQDTFAETDNFFSYRRATHAKQADYGRQISAIVIHKG